MPPLEPDDAREVEAKHLEPGSPEAISLSVLEIQNRSLKEDLDACKLQLFELLHESDQVSDATIKKEFEAICDSIENWVDEVYQNRDFSERFNSIWQNDPEKLIALGLAPPRKGPGMDTEGLQWMDWLGRQDTCNYIVISCVIWQFMKPGIFDEPFPIGITKDQKLLFKEILLLRGRDQTESNPLRTSQWRSESMNAMVRTPSFKAHRERELNLLFDDLLDDLAFWIGSKAVEYHADQLCKSVYQPAVELHKSMTCSKRNYILRRPNVSRNHPLPKDCSWTLKDIHTWRAMNHNIIGESYRVFDSLSPSLHRSEMGNEIGSELVKPVVIIFKDEHQRSIPPSPSPTRGSRRDLENRHHARHKSPKRHEHPQPERKFDSNTLSSWMRSKKKQSDSKQRYPEAEAQGSRTKSAASHRSKQSKSRRGSQVSTGEYSSNEQDQHPRYASTMPASQIPEEQAQFVPRSYSSPPERSPSRDDRPLGGHGYYGQMGRSNSPMALGNSHYENPINPDIHVSMAPPLKHPSQSPI